MADAANEARSGTRKSLGGLGDLAASVSALLALLGITLYAVLRIAYSEFYAPFGIRPDDLGGGYLDLLVQSAVGVALLMTTALFIAGIGLLISAAVFTPPATSVKQRVGRLLDNAELSAQVQPNRPAAESENQAQPHARFSNVRKTILKVLLWLLVAVAIVAATVTSLFIKRPPFPLLVVKDLVAGLLLALLGVLFTGTIALFVLLGGLKTAEQLRAGRRLWRRTVLGVMSIVVGVVLVGLIGVALYDRSQVLAGHEVSFTVLDFPITNWYAERATVNWTTDGGMPDLTQPATRPCLLYFGQSDGTAYFYVPSTRKVLRISTQDVAIHTGRGVCGHA